MENSTKLLKRSLWTKKEARQYSNLSTYTSRKLWKNCQHEELSNYVYRDKFLKEIGTSYEKEIKKLQDSEIQK